MELEAVRCAKNSQRGFSFDRQHAFNAFPEPRPKDGMLPIGLRLVPGCDAEILRERAVAQALELWKNEPHPVAGLYAGSQLDADLVLRRDETLQLVRVAHDHSFGVRRRLRAPRRSDARRENRGLEARLEQQALVWAMGGAAAALQHHAEAVFALERSRASSAWQSQLDTNPVSCRPLSCLRSTPRDA